MSVLTRETWFGPRWGEKEGGSGKLSPGRTELTSLALL